MSVSTRPRVMIVDDHSIMRDGLQELLENSGGYEVVGEARDGEEAVRVAEQVKPDIVLMDLIMPIKDGVEACRDITAALPDTRVLVLTQSTDEDIVAVAVAAGATGYVQKFAGTEKLLETIDDVVAGEFRIPGELVRRVFESMRAGPGKPETPEPDKLTEREREILRLFAQGRSYSEIGEARGNRPLTIRNAIYLIRDKLKVKTRQEMVVWAVRNGLLDDEDD